MKKLTFGILSLLAITFWCCTRSGSEAEAVKQVIDHSYIGGVHNFMGSDVIRQGFWIDFEMIIFKDDQIEKLPLETWISNIERRNEESAGQTRHLTSVKYLDIHVTGNAAIVALELYRKGEIIFTDYLSLYKFSDGWKIVSKTFYRH